MKDKYKMRCETCGYYHSPQEILQLILSHRICIACFNGSKFVNVKITPTHRKMFVQRVAELLKVKS